MFFQHGFFVFLTFFCLVLFQLCSSIAFVPAVFSPSRGVFFIRCCRFNDFQQEVLFVVQICFHRKSFLGGGVQQFVLQHVHLMRFLAKVVQSFQCLFASFFTVPSQPEYGSDGAFKFFGEILGTPPDSFLELFLSKLLQRLWRMIACHFFATSSMSFVMASRVCL